MTNRVEFSQLFIKELDRLAHRYPRVTDQVDSLINQLEQNEHPGDKIPNVGYDVYKVRLRNPSAGRGKSGGFRAIYYIRTATFIILVTIYSKSQQEDINPERIRRAIEDYLASEDGPDKN